MRRLKRYILTSVATAAALLLPGCAADSPSSPDAPLTAPDDAPFYLTFELAAPTANPSSPSHAPSAGMSTRADVAKTDAECTINSIIAYLVDAEGTNKDKIAGVAYGDNVTIGDFNSDTKKRTVTLNMGLNTLYLRKHKYRVYVLANMPPQTALTSGVIGKNISTISNLAIELRKTSYTNSDNTQSLFATKSVCLTSTDLTTMGLPLSTEDDDAAKIQVWLEEKNEDGTKGDYSTTPYVVKADTGKKDTDGNPNEKEEDGTLALTPLYARFDFVYKDNTKTDFIYPIEYQTGENATDKTTEVKVKFVQARVKRAAMKAYVLPQSTSTITFTNLSNATYDSPDVSIVNSDNYATPAVYVPEYIPSLGEATMLNYSQVTYMELDAILVQDEFCTMSDDVRKAIKGEEVNGVIHPPLYYYYDDKIQSTLTTKSPKKDGSLPAHWKEITYTTATKAGDIEGYVVTYRHAIRHSNADSTDTDGIVKPMEYAVVRNYLYQIGINSVSALPHPWKNTDDIESPNKDINIKIITPQKWNYHRGGSEITFEETE